MAQINDIDAVMKDGDFVKAKALIEQAYQNDTTNADRYLHLYHYYIDKNNEDKDSLVAYDYLLKYNSISKKKINTDLLASELLSNVYKSKDIDKFNYYIELTKDKKELNNEAQRIRNQLAYEQVKLSQSIEAYQKFVTLYPNAMQTEQAHSWLNEHLFNHYLDNEDIDSLKVFASQTQSETYKNKALSEIDKLSFKKTLKTNTTQAYLDYLTEFPNGAYVSVARTNYQKLQYEQYVVDSRITDMLSYLNTHNQSDKNYKEVLNKLSLYGLEYYSLIAMQTVFKLTNDSALVEKFAKRYAYNLCLNDINKLIDVFPFVANNEVIKEYKQKAQTLENLSTKQNLTLTDYKDNKTLYKNLNAWGCLKSFAKFEQLNSSQPKNKKVKFALEDDCNYVQFNNAKQSESDFILTDKVPINTLKPSLKEDFPSDAVTDKDNTYILFSKADTNGYNWYEGSTNRDIYVCLYEQGKWKEPVALSKPINSRADETRPILSKDKKTLWFSSNRSLNFGGLDIYVCFREDVDDWNSWSEPVLLNADLNTVDDDYVMALEDNILVLSQEQEQNPDNFVYLEGNTNFERVSGQLTIESSSNIKLTKIYILDAKTLNIVNIIHPNDKGFYSFIRPKDDFLLYCKRKHYISSLDTIANIHYIEEMVSKQELVTIASPFDEQGRMTKIGKKNMELLAQSFSQTPYILTIGVHAIKSTGKLSDKEQSQKEASLLIDFLVKQGMQRENIVVTAYGKENTMQGWENQSSIDIGAITK